MFDGSYCQLMAQYNRWMNRKIYGVCEQIPDSERRRDLGAFFKSLHGTLDHILCGDMAWMNRFRGRPPGVTIGEQLYEDFSGLRQAREAMDETIVDWAQSLEDGWLQADFGYTSGIDGRTRVLPAWVLVTHMFNHQTHHRGQATTLIKQLGHEPGMTDIPWLPELNAEVA